MQNNVSMKRGTHVGRSALRGAVFALASAAVWLSATPARARLHPLPHIAQQTVKPNVLINYDTHWSERRLSTQTDNYGGSTIPGQDCYFGIPNCMGYPTCHIAATGCSSNSDCTTPGDYCQFAHSSRGMVVKQSFRRFVRRNMNTMNLGLKSYAQTADTNMNVNPNRYLYRYVKANVASGTTTITMYYDVARMMVATTTSGGTTPCLPAGGPPASTCWFDNRAMTLTGASSAPNTNSANVYRYVVNYDQGYKSDVATWAGMYKTMAGPLSSNYAGNYEGSWYKYTDYATVQTSTVVQKFYQNWMGRTYFDGTDHWIYNPDWNDIAVEIDKGFPPRPASAGCCECNGVNCGGVGTAGWPNGPCAPSNATTSPRGSKTFVTIDPTGINNVVNNTMVLVGLERFVNGGAMAHGPNGLGCSIYPGYLRLTTDKAAALALPDLKADDSIYKYFSDVIDADTTANKSCRINAAVIALNWKPDGWIDGGDEAPGCKLDPPDSTCWAAAVWNVRRLRLDLGVKTFVTGFDLNAGEPTQHAPALDNVAFQGGAPKLANGVAPFMYHRQAKNEEELFRSYEEYGLGAMYPRGSFATSPSSTGAATYAADGTVTLSTIVLDARVDYPGWRGHLDFFDTAPAANPSKWTTTPDPTCWDASRSPVCTTAQKNFNTFFLNPDDKGFNSTEHQTNWKTRRIYTTNAANAGAVIRLDVTSGSLASQSAFVSLGLGSSNAEADQVARWLAGDPAMQNYAPLGGLVFSTPIDIPPGDSKRYPSSSSVQRTRPYLTYVGGSDGMLHAFYTKQQTVSSVVHYGGEEAFAYIPPQLLSSMRNLYVQRGQTSDPYGHKFGVAASPKYNEICTSLCSSTDPASPPVYKTVLVVGSGFNGAPENVQEMYALDVSNPMATTPVSLLWSTETKGDGQNHHDRNNYDAYLGWTTSTPAFYYAKTTSMDDYRMIFASSNTDSGSSTQGTYLISAKVNDGRITGGPSSGISHALPSSGANCLSSDATVRVIATDVAVARNYNKTGAKEMLAAYFGDTWGNLYRYVPGVDGSGYTTNNGTVSSVAAFGCHYPLHSSPSIVQLDTYVASTGSTGSYYLVQVTNSALDPATIAWTESSKVQILKETASSGSVTQDATWGTSGVMTLDPAVNTDFCLSSTSTGDCTGAQTGLPAGVRPIYAPTVVLMKDNVPGFIIISSWYSPGYGCAKGSSYITITQVKTDGTRKQLYGAKVADQMVEGAVFVSGGLRYVGDDGGLGVLPTNVVAPPLIVPPSANIVSGSGGLVDRYRIYSWSEGS